MSDSASSATPVDRLVMPRVGIYLVSRTSCWEGQPCDEAYEVEMIKVDRRTVDDPKKIPVNNGTDGDWYERGTNHRIEDGKICRDLGFYSRWAVQVNDIMDFVDDHGCCMVSRDSEGFANIEIYDDYRE